MNSTHFIQFQHAAKEQVNRLLVNHNHKRIIQSIKQLQ